MVPFLAKSVWLPWAIAACLAVACSYLVAERMGLKSHVSDLEKRDILAQVQIASLNSKLENAPDANAVVVWDEKKQRGILKVTSCPVMTKTGITKFGWSIRNKKPGWRRHLPCL